MSATINPLVIFALIFLVVLNIILFAVGSAHVDASNRPKFIDEALDRDEFNEASDDAGNKAEGLSLIKSMTFGYFINIDSIEEKGVRVILRILLTSIVQMIPLLILIFAGLDFIRGR